MAKSTGWTFFLAILLGIVGTTVFWLYSPFLDQKVANQIEAALKNKEFSIQALKGSGAEIQGAPSMAQSHRFLLISGNNQTFLADLKDGRVWRYFRHSKEGGWPREAEGFIPLRFYFQGKKFYAASEASPDQIGNPRDSNPESGLGSN
ncbi:MAG: hypothetical protein JRI66_07350 [Deltaproteobacteria bacterium]|nr:hypothetical protein [Deltaproteobacteria bacterium]